MSTPSSASAPSADPVPRFAEPPKTPPNQTPAHLEQDLAVVRGTPTSAHKPKSILKPAAAGPDAEVIGDKQP